MTDFRVGDRVYITARRQHPWAGQAGVITRAAEMPGFDWVVSLERDDAYSGHEVGAAAAELRRERRRKS